MKGRRKSESGEISNDVEFGWSKRVAPICTRRSRLIGPLSGIGSREGTEIRPCG